MKTVPQFVADRRGESAALHRPMLQRKCSCGGSAVAGGECAECRKKKLSRFAAGQEPGAIPSIVTDVLRGSGQPLDAATRGFVEPRFGHDFSQVRVHADARAADSASAVNALAYTMGNQVVFGAGQFSPGTTRGMDLLAHELAHVVQQGDAPVAGPPRGVSSPGDPSERSAEALSEAALRGSAAPGQSVGTPPAHLFRRVGSVTCPPDVFGAPADPRAALDTINPIAVDFANRTADALAADAATVAATGVPDPLSPTLQAFQDHLGMPVAVGSGFMNRLTGLVRPSLEIALTEELRIVSRRFRISATVLNGTVNFNCPGAATVTLPGCAAGSCGPNFAFSCRGGGTMALCQPFWELASDELKAGTLIHESLHMIFGVSNPRQPGEIGEETQRGPGRNFNVAGCYEFLVDAVAGMNSNAVCPPVP